MAKGRMCQRSPTNLTEPKLSNKYRFYKYIHYLRDLFLLRRDAVSVPPGLFESGSTQKKIEPEQFLIWI